jgi:hypothetical protein
VISTGGGVTRCDGRGTVAWSLVVRASGHGRQAQEGTAIGATNASRKCVRENRRENHSSAKAGKRGLRPVVSARACSNEVPGRGHYW